ncbi:hypothetical protein ACFQ1T_07705 [Methylophilus glucosoxydans]|uniref:Uncharacterized protein n=1 Tax=Methylophilus glucosoxydans TaxID=752553 RepID=A0ABW3GG93_9PROT
MKKHIPILLLSLAVMLFTSAVFSMDGEPRLPKIAVSNLAYKREVKDYFFESQSDFQAKTQARKNANRLRQSESYKNEVEFSTRSKSSIKTKTEFKELKQFMADIKGELIKSGNFTVIESPPYTANNEKIYDVIQRIKMKNFKGADYVLFGVLNSVQADENVVEIKSTTTNSLQYFVNLQADFSLIDTRTFKVIAAFSSVGNAQQTILSDEEKHDVVRVNHARLISDLSKDFAADVIRQIHQQLGPVEPGKRSDEDSKAKPSKNSEVTVYY